MEKKSFWNTVAEDFENNKDLIESTNDDFLREMDRYIESHKYFSMYLWLDKKMHPLELDVEHVL